MHDGNKREKVNDKLFNFRPLFFSAASLSLGVLFAYLRIFKDVSAWWSVLLLPFAVASFCFCKTKRRLLMTAVAVVWLTACFCFGYATFQNTTLDFTDTRQYAEQTEIVGRIREKTKTEYNTYVLLDEVQIGGEGQDGKAIVYFSKSDAEPLRLADVIRVYGYVWTDVSFHDENGLRAEAVNKNLRFFVSEVASLEKIGEDFLPFDEVRARMERVVYEGMDETPAAVTMAVLTGETAGIDYDLLENVRMGGIAHIFAVSGLHFGALYAFCLLIFAKTPLKNLSKIAQFLLMAGLLIFYAGVCGFTASVLRAMVLCLTHSAVKGLGIKGDSLETLGLAAFLILIFQPMQLFCVGFQLSFAACLGIVLLVKPLERAFHNGYDCMIFAFAGKNKEKIIQRREERRNLPPTLWDSARRWVISLFSVSLATQIFTAPILLQSFGYVSGWALLLNLFFVPLISVVFSWLLLFIFVACALPVSASSVILYLPSTLWSAVLLLFEACDFSSFALRGIEFSSGGILCYYLACTFCSDKWNICAKLRRIFVFLLGGACAVALFLRNVMPIL